VVGSNSRNRKGETFLKHEGLPYAWRKEKEGGNVWNGTPWGVSLNQHFSVIAIRLGGAAQGEGKAMFHVPAHESFVDGVSKS